MTDRELLERAAKAADLEVTQNVYYPGALFVRDASGQGEWRFWNPLADDGDALRLALKLNLRIDYVGVQACVEGVMAPGLTAEEAARRAIVRAAAAMNTDDRTSVRQEQAA